MKSVRDALNEIQISLVFERRECGWDDDGDDGDDDDDDGDDDDDDDNDNYNDDDEIDIGPSPATNYYPLRQQRQQLKSSPALKY